MTAALVAIQARLVRRGKRVALALVVLEEVQARTYKVIL